MSYIRPVKLEPSRLELLASKAYIDKVVEVLRKHRHYVSDALCLRVLRKQIGDQLRDSVAKSVRQDLVRFGSSVIQKANWSALRDFLVPDLLVPFLYVFYSSDIRILDLPVLVRGVDRLMVLDLLNNVGTPGGHDLEMLKVRMFERSEISVEEGYLVKRVLRGLINIRAITLWKVCDNSMLQILGVTCKHLELLDIWKSVAVTDTGVSMLLGLEAEKPFKVASTLKKVLIKDTSITDRGAFQLLFWCLKLEVLDFSQDSFLQQFLCRIGDSYLKFEHEFTLKSIFLPVSEPLLFHSVIRALPDLEDLSIWSNLSQVPDLRTSDLAKVQSLKLGGVPNKNFLTEFLSIIGCQLVSLKLETIYFDISIDDIGRHCPNLEQLSIINARASLSTALSSTSSSSSSSQASTITKAFNKLKLVYLFLVQYTDSQFTALHYILAQANNIESIHVTGTPYLTDSCISSLLKLNPMSKLKRFVMTHPVGQDQPLVVPLTARSVTNLHKSCPDLQCIGDLKFWCLTSSQRRKVSRDLGCTLSIPK